MSQRFYSFLLILAGCCCAGSLTAQQDSIVLKNGNVIVGEIKSLDKGVLTVETDYSKNDFTIEWTGVKEIYSKTRFLLTLTDGKRFNGYISSVAKTDSIQVRENGVTSTITRLDELVYIKGLKSDFWSRVHASIDLGINLTKANNLQQYNSRSSIGYLADKWSVDVVYNGLRSKQDSVATTKRTEVSVAGMYFLQNDWFLNSSLNFLSNTEQALDLRTSAKVGMGKFLAHTNRFHFALAGGVNYNNESFTNETPSRNSMEGYFGYELNLFDIGDLNLLNQVVVYPSFTESGRWRSDIRLDTKYDLPLDFYIKLGLTLNYDNQPAVAGKETDYVFAFSVGWEL